MAYPKNRAKAIGRVYVRDLTGQEFGFLTVESRGPNLGKHAQWNCRCTCGKACLVAGLNLTATGSGRVLSCGCWRVERMKLVGAEVGAIGGRSDGSS